MSLLILYPCELKKFESADQYQTRSCLGLLKKKPQSTQSSAIPVTTYEKAAPLRLRTRMTRIARIFTDPCVSASSAQSVFYRNPSAFICVHLRLIFVSLSDRIQNIQFELFRSRVENDSVKDGIWRGGI
jgi:hypothetical protein